MVDLQKLHSHTFTSEKLFAKNNCVKKKVLALKLHKSQVCKYATHPIKNPASTKRGWGQIYNLQYGRDVGVLLPDGAPARLGLVSQAAELLLQQPVLLHLQVVVVLEVLQLLEEGRVEAGQLLPQPLHLGLQPGHLGCKG